MTYLAIGDYSPKLGETVKATLGDSVLYGTVDARSSLPGDPYLFPLGSTVRVYLGSQWSYEPWSPPITFKPLTVVCVADDVLLYIDPDAYGAPEDVELVSEDSINTSPFFARSAYDYWVQPGDTSWEFKDAEIQRALAAGKAEVLFAGVAIEPSGDKGVDE